MWSRFRHSDQVSDHGFGRDTKLPDENFEKYRDGTGIEENFKAKEYEGRFQAPFGNTAVGRVLHSA